MRSYLPPEQTRWFLKVKAKGIQDLQRIRRDIKLKARVLFAFPYLRDNKCREKTSERAKITLYAIVIEQLLSGFYYI